MNRLPTTPERYRVVVSGKTTVHFRHEVVAKGFADHMHSLGRHVRIYLRKQLLEERAG